MIFEWKRLAKYLLLQLFPNFSVNQYRLSSSMWIIAGSLFFSLAVFPYSAESNSVTLRDLFPETNGEDLPHIEVFPYVETRRTKNFRKIIGLDMEKFDANSKLVARRHIIIGWKHRDVIAPLSNLFGDIDTVFDTHTNTFETLSDPELERLGVHRRLSFVLEEDKLETELKAAHRLNHPENHPEYHRANIYAIHHAYYVSSRQANANPANADQANANQLIDHQAKLQALRDAYYQSYHQTNQQVLGGYLHNYGRTK